jgi:hypothetical protein
MAAWPALQLAMVVMAIPKMVFFGTGKVKGTFTGNMR